MTPKNEATAPAGDRDGRGYSDTNDASQDITPIGRVTAALDPRVMAADGWWAIYAHEPQYAGEPSWYALRVIAWQTEVTGRDDPERTTAYVYPVTSDLESYGSRAESRNLIAVVHESEMTDDARETIRWASCSTLERNARQYLDARAAR